MDLTKLVRAAIFTALAVGLGFSLLLVPNVELITVLIFLAGLCLGPAWGMLVGGTAELVYSGLNPLGSGLSFPPLLAAQLLAMILIGGLGGLLRPLFFQRYLSAPRRAALGLTGFLLTALYDFLTTLSYPLSAGFDWPQTVGIFLTGMGFTFLHQVSNAIVFVIAVPRVVNQLAPQDE